MGTRFQPADPDAVHRRFAEIRKRAIARVAEEQRATLAKLAGERRVESQSADAGRAWRPRETSPRREPSED